MKTYRPWGPLPWLDRKFDSPSWSVLGVSGTEERGASTLMLIPSTRRKECRFLRIIDPESANPSEYEDRLDTLAEGLVALGVDQSMMPEVPLLANIDEIRDQVSAFLENSGPDIILDITSMPKWWFFPTLRFLLEDDRAKTLIVTYGSGVKYASHLASNTRALEPLPTFEGQDGRSEHKELIVAIGFAPLELADLYAEPMERVRYLFPFPPGPPHFERNWRFLQDLEERIAHDRRHDDDRWHVNMYDCPSVFEALERFTDKGRRTSALAPFGPKTISLAMCLFSLACEAADRPSVPAFYTQPKRYALNYTTGIKYVNGEPDVRAYAIKIKGRVLYQLT